MRSADSAAKRQSLTYQWGLWQEWAAGRPSILGAVQFSIIVSLVYLSRIPFLNAGYGTDWDAWAMALAARSIALTGHYSASRLPGYPVVEFFYSLLWQSGPIAFNTVTALLSAIGIGFFALTLRFLRVQHWFIASLALASIPVVYINSTTSMDYIWAMAFSLASLYFVYTDRPLVAGLLLGLAIGSRITSVLLVIPLGILLTRSERDMNLRRLLLFFSSACIFGAAFYVPVAMSYGREFLTFYASGYPPIAAVVRIFTTEIWGAAGLLAVAIAVASLAIQWKSSSRIPSHLNSVRRDTVAWTTAIGFYLLLFFRLPHEAGYLIPALPFVILVLAKYLTRPAFMTFCMLLLLSPWVVNVTSKTYMEWLGRPVFSSKAIYLHAFNNTLVLDPLYGPLIADYKMRRNGETFVDQVQANAASLGVKSVIVTGTWLTKFQVATQGEQAYQVEYIYLFKTAEEIERYQTKGYQILYLPGQLEYNLSKYQIDLLDYGAQPVPLKS